jgi:aspartyl-tRNA(Asn)/glutamyl-tRNA(Gln) amidotransferase subunit A
MANKKNILIKEKVRDIKEGRLTALKNLMDYSEKIACESGKFNIFLKLNENAINEAKEIDLRISRGEKVGKLAGICFALKSNICYKGIEVNCASKVLEGFVAPYNATVVGKLLSEDAILIGMVNMDEFACGGSGETSAFGPVKNPLNFELIPGGSSSGSAASVAGDFCDFALGSDTGGSIRNPASHCGIVGLKPSYGLVSRYGLIDMCMSFDCIGPLVKSVEDAELILDVIKGQDHFDTTTKDLDGVKESSLVKSIRKDGKKVIGLINVHGFATKEIGELISKKTKEISKKNNFEIIELELPLEIALETYYILVYTEFFSGTRKFDGRRFGKPIEKFAGPEVLRRIIGGEEITKSEFEGKYYREALKSRNFIKNEFEKIFKKCDFIILPTVPKLAHKIGEKIIPKEMYAYDVFTVLANISGIPAISVPVGKIGGKSLGLQIMAPYFLDYELLEFAKRFE